MQKILNRIKQQQKDMGYYELTQKSDSFKWSYIRSITLALHTEVSEFLQEIPWKPWDAIENQPLDIIAAGEELMDIMVFTFVLWLTLSPSIDLEDAMEQTLVKIENRIKHGYGREK